MNSAFDVDELVTAVGSDLGVLLFTSVFSAFACPFFLFPHARNRPIIIIIIKNIHCLFVPTLCVHHRHWHQLLSALFAPSFLVFVAFLHTMLDQRWPMDNVPPILLLLLDYDFFQLIISLLYVHIIMWLNGNNTHIYICTHCGIGHFCVFCMVRVPLLPFWHQ